MGQLAPVIKPEQIQAIHKLAKDAAAFERATNTMAGVAAMISVAVGSKEDPAATKKKAAFDELCNNREILKSMGLKLSIGDKQGMVLVGNDGITKGSKVIFEINGDTEAKQLFGFLAALTPGQAQDPKTKEALARVAESFFDQVATETNFTKPSDESIKILANLKKLSEAFARLDIQPQAERLQLLGVYANDRALKEYIALDKAGLLTPPNADLSEGQEADFGPGDWYTDMIPSRYGEKWFEAMETLEQAAENPKADGLITVCAMNLGRCIQHSKAGIREKREAGYYEGFSDGEIKGNDATSKALLGTLAWATKRLKEITSKNISAE